MWILLFFYRLLLVGKFIIQLLSIVIFQVLNHHDYYRIISLGLLSLPTFNLRYHRCEFKVGIQRDSKGATERFRDLVTDFRIFKETTEQQISREDDRNARVSSCTLSKLLVIATNSDWFIALFATIEIGQSYFFGIDFSTVIWNYDWLIALFAPLEIGRRNFFGIDFFTVIRKPLKTI